MTYIKPTDLPSHISINPMQQAVLEKLINGYSYKAIAYDLNISMASVRQYAHRLYKKLNVTNKMEILLRYVHAGTN
ncbi:MAG: helix-turn-helix transcriptional regulator [Saprospiraceae bacterium]|nr:helix-turn-helix transcriptional regulator [Saprospiraceae bacterium]